MPQSTKTGAVINFLKRAPAEDKADTDYMDKQVKKSAEKNVPKVTYAQQQKMISTSKKYQAGKYAPRKSVSK